MRHERKERPGKRKVPGARSRAVARQTDRHKGNMKVRYTERKKGKSPRGKRYMKRDKLRYEESIKEHRLRPSIHNESE